jgi:hypothetical protein
MFKRYFLFMLLLFCMGVCCAPSVLADGDIYKIAVDADGIYKISYEQWVSMGVDVANLNPRNVKLYGNGGGMLSASAGELITERLPEVAIVVVGEMNGSFE